MQTILVFLILAISILHLSLKWMPIAYKLKVQQGLARALPSLAKRITVVKSGCGSGCSNCDSCESAPSALLASPNAKRVIFLKQK